ncbi:2-oxoglutarate dehydrogenase, E2 component, dihydrolipoamide succinyltransferase [Cellulomonas sp. KRMCY2]|uniref:2-oxoglutarate dehydrogenase, E2 component, dihydrolipoamide succinyltransferase n=1 Tax=Cellulomonas sp. KRMCY2 TaxID=1304865 RepID=UPI00045EBF88|nr:2-oxoglutarate dehydrogenase, E2 component, dihydrolipoamide succinyltransferase [Cellulomonas sp. KRMCY2]
MTDSVLMPALGESVTEGTVTRWLKQVGDEVALDEPLLEVSTDKVDTEIPSPFAGTLTEILVAEDETVEVGTALATIGSADQAADAGEQPSAEQAPPAAEAPAADQAPDEVPESAPQETWAQPAATQEQAPAAPAAAPAAPSGGPSQDVTMPALGESVTEGTVTRWLKQVGDEVALDEPLLEVSTDKVDTEIPSPFAGTLTEILVAEDETVEVGTALARIGASGGAPAPSAPESTPESAPVEPAAVAEPERSDTGAGDEVATAPAVAPQPEARTEPQQAPTPVASAQPTASGGAGGYLTPLVRKLAAEKGVDLAALVGTGVGGRIRKEDVLDAAAKAEQERAARAAQEQAQAAAAAAAPAAPPAVPSAPRPAAAATSVSPLRGTTEKASRLRQVIATRMVESLHSMAQLTTIVEVDVTKVARLRARAKNDFRAREGVNLTYLPFFVLAATEALKAHPKVNGFLDGNQITYHGEENVGIAVDTDRGLVVPVIRSAGDLNLAGIARKIADLAERTRANKVTPDELSGATFTVTNTGSGGALFDTPIVPGGTSAILGTGGIVKRPVVATDEDGGEYIAIRSMCYLALSYDHRLVDGADASRYLMAVKRRIEDADFESEVGV